MISETWNQRLIIMPLFWQMWLRLSIRKNDFSTWLWPCCRAWWDRLPGTSYNLNKSILEDLETAIQTPDNWQEIQETYHWIVISESDLMACPSCRLLSRNMATLSCQNFVEPCKKTAVDRTAIVEMVNLDRHRKWFNNILWKNDSIQWFLKMDDLL